MTRARSRTVTTSSEPALAGPGPWTLAPRPFGPGLDRTRPVSGGPFAHDFTRVRIVAARSSAAAETGAPIQCVRWRWSAGTGGAPGSWSAVGASSSTSTPPSHSGSYDGEEYEDAPYSQATDPTVAPFLRGGRRFLGERGARQQARGVAPSAEDVRETAVQAPGLRGGSGLHEGVVTSDRGAVAASGDPVQIGLQSGLRSSTARTLFHRTPVSGESVPPSGREVGAHTGFALNPSGRGSTHTRGQAPGHDRLRDARRSSAAISDPQERANALYLAHLETQARTPDVLGSEYLGGIHPTVSSVGVVGPPASGGASVDPVRQRLAGVFHPGLERSKKRVRSLKRTTGRGRSPSPPRLPPSLGGGYDPGPAPLSPVPHFEGAPGSWEHYANQAAWVSAPQREGFDFGPPPPIPTPTTTTTTTTTAPPPTPLVPTLPPPPLTLASTPVVPPTPTAAALAPPRRRRKRRASGSPSKKRRSKNKRPRGPG